VTANPYILLVEDNQDDIDLTLRALKRSRLLNDVIVMKNGADAVDFLLRQGAHAEREPTTPQVVLLDINLPKLNGIDVLKRLRAHEPTRLLPVVMLTTSNEDRDVLDSYNFGANSYVRKPVSFESFTQAIAQLGLYWLVLNKPVTR
jgi:two-component system response regulator